MVPRCDFWYHGVSVLSWCFCGVIVSRCDLWYHSVSVQGLPRLKVYNNSVLCEEIEDVEQDDDEADGDEEEAEIECFQDLTRNLRETSKARQIIVSKYNNIIFFKCYVCL